MVWVERNSAGRNLSLLACTRNDHKLNVTRKKLPDQRGHFHRRDGVRVQRVHSSDHQRLCLALDIQFICPPGRTPTGWWFCCAISSFRATTTFDVGTFQIKTPTGPEEDSIIEFECPSCEFVSRLRPSRGGAPPLLLTRCRRRPCSCAPLTELD